MAEKVSIFEGVDTSVLSHHADVKMKGNTLELKNLTSVNVVLVQLLCALKKDYSINIELFTDYQTGKLLVNTGFCEVFTVHFDSIQH